MNNTKLTQGLAAWAATALLAGSACAHPTGSVAHIGQGAANLVIFHTGHHRLLGRDNAELLRSQAGPGIEAARWLAARQVVAVGGDSGSMEAMPHERPGVLFPVHQILLAQSGIHILENIATQRLVDAGWSEFLFILSPIPMVGSSSSWVNPVAIR